MIVPRLPAISPLLYNLPQFKRKAISDQVNLPQPPWPADLYSASSLRCWEQIENLDPVNSSKDQYQHPPLQKSMHHPKHQIWQYNQPLHPHHMWVMMKGWWRYSWYHISEPARRQYALFFTFLEVTYQTPYGIFWSAIGHCSLDPVCANLYSIWIPIRILSKLLRSASTSNSIIILQNKEIRNRMVT